MSDYLDGYWNIQSPSPEQKGRTGENRQVVPPPLGCRPRWLVEEERAVELITAIGRRPGGERHWPEPEWCEELAELLRRIKARAAGGEGGAS